jgi:sulfonate transport system substrate-binding protein
VSSLSKSIFLAAALLAVAAIQASAETTLRIGYLRGSEPLNLARIQGRLEKVLAADNVKVEWKGPFGAYAPAAEALNANAIDLTVGSSSAALTSIAGDAPLSLFAYQWEVGDTSGIIVRKESPIKTLADLKGKTVAVNRGGTGEYLLALALEKANVPAADVKKAYLTPPDSASALLQNKVDAWAAWSTFYTVALAEQDARVIADAGSFGSENAIVYVMRTDFANANPNVLNKVLATLRETNAWALQHRDEAAAVWEKELRVSPAVAKIIASYKQSSPGAIGPRELVALDHQNDWLVSQNILRRKADVQAHLVKGLDPSLSN